MSLTSIELDLVKVFAIRIVQVHSTRDARIEGVNRPQNFERLFRVCQLGANQRFLVGRALSFGIARRSIPSAGYYELVVFDLSILDPDPMRQGPARGPGALDQDQGWKDRKLPTRSTQHLECFAARCQRTALGLRGSADWHQAGKPGTAARNSADDSLLRSVHRVCCAPVRSGWQTPSPDQVLLR